MTNPTGVESISMDDAVDQLAEANADEVEVQEPESELEEVEDSEELQPEATEVEEEDDEVEGETDEAEEELEADDGTFIIESGDNKLELTEQDINGLLELKDLDVPFADLKSNVLMQRDFTQKTQDLSTQRKTLEANVEEKLTALAETQEMAEAVLLGDLQQYQDVDWEKLREEDPYTFEDSFIKYQKASTRYQELQKSIETSYAGYNEQQAAKQQETLVEETELLKQVIPEAKSPSTWKPVQERISSYLSELGFPEGTLDSVVDHKYMQVLNQASLYNSIKDTAKVSEKVKKTTVLRAGKPKTKKQTNKVARKQILEKAFESGNTEDAVDALASLMRQRT